MVTSMIVPKSARFFADNNIYFSTPSSRTTVRILPQGKSTSYKPRDILDIQINDPCYLDGACSYLSFQMVTACTDGANNVACAFLSAHSLIERLVISDGQGVVMEEINNYNVLYHLLRKSMTGLDNKNVDSILVGGGFEDFYKYPVMAARINTLAGTANSWGNPTATTPPTGADISTLLNTNISGTDVNGTAAYRTSTAGLNFVLPLTLSGVFFCNKYIPLKKFIGSGMKVSITLAPATMALVGSATATTLDYTLNNVNFVYDRVQFDDAFDQAMDQKLAEFGSLELYYDSYTNFSPKIPNQGNVPLSWLLNSKSIKDIYAVMLKDTNTASLTANSYTFNACGITEYNLDIGGTRIPGAGVKGFAEMYAELRKSFNILNDYSVLTTIDSETYSIPEATNNGDWVLRTTAAGNTGFGAANSNTFALINTYPSASFILGLNLEKHIRDSKQLVLSGYDVQTNKLYITLNLNVPDAVAGGTTCHIFSHVDKIYKISVGQSGQVLQ